MIELSLRTCPSATACSLLGVAVAIGLTLWSAAVRADTTTHFDIDEFRVTGNTVLPVRDIETAVYDFLGPHKTADDVEKARAALENLYQKRGYPTVTVEVPRQTVGSGVIMMAVTERKIGRLRVAHAHYFEPDAIRDAAPSLAPGTVPNINAVQHDMRALNQLAERQVTPELKPGRDPDTMDVDLNVTDRLPLHGSLELNNRQSADTTPLRLAASLGYDNLWQRGDAIALFFQVAPQDTANALVYSASYTFRIPGTDLAIIGSYLKSNSNVASVGGTNVVGKGQIAGFRVLLPLGVDGVTGFSHNLLFGADYKQFDQLLTLSGTGNEIPLTYYPITIEYDANWTGSASHTELSMSAVMGTGFGSSTAELEENRAYATGNFFYVKGSLSHTHDLPWGMQFWGKLQGQATTDSLVPNEQFNAGGAESVRGYLEAEVLGDSGAAVQLELRSPSFAHAISPTVNELRIHLFADAADVTLNQPLTEQRRDYRLGSIGVGIRARIADHASASVEDAYTLSDAVTTKHGNDAVLFRVIGDF